MRLRVAGELVVVVPEEGEDLRVVVQVEATDGTRLELLLDGDQAAGLGLLLVEHTRPTAQA